MYYQTYNYSNHTKSSNKRSSRKMNKANSLYYSQSSSYDDSCSATEISVSSSSDCSSTVRSSRTPKGGKFYNRPYTGPKYYSTKPHDAPMGKKDMYFAVDCEMVGVGPEGLDSALARVSIVNWNNEIVLDTYVKVEQEVTDYRTFVSGITAEHINSDYAMPLKAVQGFVCQLLRGKILIGHGLENDLKVMGIDHPWCDIRDTAKYAPFMRLINKENYEQIFCPRKLRDLVSEKLHKNIQEVGKAHSPVEDAIAAMDLYKSARTEWELSLSKQVNSQSQEMRSDTTSSVRAPLGDRTRCDTGSNIAGNSLLFGNNANYAAPAPVMVPPQQHHVPHSPVHSQYNMTMQAHAPTPMAYNMNMYNSYPMYNQHGNYYQGGQPQPSQGYKKNNRPNKLQNARRAQDIARAKVLAAIHQHRTNWQQQQA